MSPQGFSSFQLHIDTANYLSSRHQLFACFPTIALNHCQFMTRCSDRRKRRKILQCICVCKAMRYGIKLQHECTQIAYIATQCRTEVDYGMKLNFLNAFPAFLSHFHVMPQLFKLSSIDCFFYEKYIRCCQPTNMHMPRRT